MFQTFQTKSRRPGWPKRANELSTCYELSLSSELRRRGLVITLKAMLSSGSLIGVFFALTGAFFGVVLPRLVTLALDYPLDLPLISVGYSTNCSTFSLSVGFCFGLFSCNLG